MALTSILGVVNVVLTMLNKLSDGDHDKYHMFDTIPAYITVVMRMAGFVCFMVGSVRSLMNEKNGSSRVDSYFKQLLVLGTIYLTIIPMGMVLVSYVDSMYRKEVFFIGIELGRFLVGVWLAYLSGGRRSAYREAINQSFMEKGEKYY